MLRFLLFALLGFTPGIALAEPVGQVRVIDADTWDVGGETVRLFGIDAPEMDQDCTRDDGSAWNCGKWAAAEAGRRYEGRHAECRAVNTDRYGRTVARCSVDGTDAAREMVQDGLALAYRQYSMDYDLDEKAAHVRGVGIHAGSIQRPSEFRAARASAAPAPVGDCRIKGNISSKGEHIYHVPGQENYGRTRISVAKGERWFCSEAEASAAGWRRAQR